jgi:hypothetical protein
MEAMLFLLGKSIERLWAKGEGVLFRIFLNIFEEYM